MRIVGYYVKRKKTNTTRKTRNTTRIMSTRLLKDNKTTTSVYIISLIG